MIKAYLLGPALQASIIPAISVSNGNPLPAHILNGNKLKREISAGDMIIYDVIEISADSILWKLSEEQDRSFNFV